jgi:hypothetical protein
MFHVIVDTTNLSGAGYLDLTFTALAGAAPATTTLTHFDGAVGTGAITTGLVVGTIGSALTSTHQQWAILATVS